MKHETKKQFIFLAPLSFVLIPLIVSAAGLVPCGGPDEDPCTACDLLILFQNVLKKALEIAFLIVIGSIVYGGFRWIFSGGNETSIKTGQKIITNAIIGIVIILTAWLIVNTVFWLIKTIGGKDYTGTWFHIDCSELSGFQNDGTSNTDAETEPVTDTDTELTPVSKCYDCGKAIWGYCDKQECLSLGDCEFKAYFLMAGWGYCINK